jgi:glutamate racemase
VYKTVNALAVLDWGIGGIPLFQQLCAAAPGAELLYLSDSGSVPYGRQSPEALRGRLEEIAAFAGGLGAGTLALACNAISSVLPATRSRAGGVEVLSLIHAFIDGGSMPRDQVVALIGGERAIESGIYQRALEAAGNQVIARATQELSALIEGENREAIPGFLEKTLAALYQESGGIDTLVLACTHYPAVSPILRRMAREITLIDPGSALRDLCLRRLSGSTLRREGRRRYLTTGSAENSRRAAETAFGFSALPFVAIPDLSLPETP